MNRKTIMTMILSAGLLISACTLSSVAVTESASGGAPESQAGASSSQGGNDAASPPTKAPTQSNNNGNAPSQPSGQSNPPPTAVPTKPASSGNSNSSGSSSSGLLTISNVTTYPQNAVYYGNCVNEETMVNIQATLDPLDIVASATIYYGYTGPAGTFGNYSASMHQLGIGDYAADIDVGLEADFPLGGNDGTLDVYIQAIDKNGDPVDSNWVSIPVKNCGGVLGPPPEDVALLNFTGPVNATAGDTITLEWEVLNACKVFLNGDEVATHVGSYNYAIPSHWGGQDYRFTLSAWGNSCDNSSEVSANHDMWIDTIQTTISKGSGDLYDSYSLDFGDGNGDDVIFDHRSDGTVLYTVWGSELKSYGNWEPSSVAECVSELNAGSFTEVQVNVDQFICYKTGSGNYGYLKIRGMFLDFDERTNSYVSVSYYTELAP